MAAQNTLLYDHTFWKKLCPEGPKLNTTEKQHLILSLMLYLKSSTLDVLEFMFTTDITPVKRRAGRFVAYCPNSLDETRRFPPAVIYRAWHDRYPDAHDDLHDMIIPCAHEIVLQESDNIIQDKALKVTGSQLTHSAFEDMLTPGKLMGMYQQHAPLTWGLLQTISASPNPYRKRKAREAKQNALHEAEDDIASGEELEGLTEQQGEDVDGDAGGDSAPGKDGPSTKMPKGFSRNPEFAGLIAISLLTFARNRSTNALPLLIGLFLKIEGTSARTHQMLSNLGLSVSLKTVERIKESVSDDCVRNARALICSGNLFTIVFDNINLYLRKYQQRITNRNTMIHATNAAVIAIPEEGINKAEARDVKSKLDKRGGRSEATFQDILPTKEDGAFIKKAFVNLIAELLVRYTPGSDKWEDKKVMLEEIAKERPKDRPLPVHKTDTRPFGVFDVNEGSKKGIVELLGEMRERAGMSEDEWSHDVKVFVGDWLSSNNIWRFELRSAFRIQGAWNEPTLSHPSRAN